MKQKRVRNLPWRNGSTTIAGKKLRSGRRWPEVVNGGSGSSGGRARLRERPRERERESDAKWRGLARGGYTGQRWSQVAGDGQQWSEGVVAVGERRERESTRERESARERESTRERESARERDTKWWPEEEVAWWLHWPKGVVQRREAAERERESCRGWRGEEEEGSRFSNPK